MARPAGSRAEPDRVAFRARGREGGRSLFDPRAHGTASLSDRHRRQRRRARGAVGRWLVARRLDRGAPRFAAAGAGRFYCRPIAGTGAPGDGRLRSWTNNCIGGARSVTDIVREGATLSAIVVIVNDLTQDWGIEQTEPLGANTL